MPQPVVHFEVIGKDPERLRGLGGTRVLGPVTSPNGLVVGHFTDPEGNLLGVAGTS